MLYTYVPVPATMMEEWVLADGASKHRVAIDRLIQLRIFSEMVDRYAAFLVFSLSYLDFQDTVIARLIHELVFSSIL